MTRKFLVADDAKFIRVVLREILSKHYISSEIYEVENGQEAIEQYKKSKPDLVFLDVNMPKVDGMEALHFITKFDPGAKIIMISGIEQKYMMHQAVRQGARGFVMKPFSESEVIGTVEKMLSK